MNPITLTPTPLARITQHRLVIAGLLTLLVVLVFYPGLAGPFLFDDPVNIINPFRAWLAGETGWQEVVFGNRSGPLGRPLSMATFALNGATTGLEVVPFKATNLLIHLLCGAALYALLVRLLLRDARLQARAQLVAGILTAIWLLHPIQVSTVLYVVQRMAQLSTLFTLLALVWYVIGRQALEQGQAKRGYAWLFLWLPAATVAGMLSKENGALVPLFCLVLELGYFQPKAGQHRPKGVLVFYVLSLLMPLALMAVFYPPTKMMASYDGRLFTLGERLLTQPRALWDYIGALLVPSGPSLGVYTDDFVVSRGWLQPPTTLFAIVGLIALVGLALFTRTRVPAVFTGLGFFFAGHAMESTIFPLEMYFEHRNYLPSAGLFLAVAGVIGWLLPRLRRGKDQPNEEPRLLWLALGVYVLLLAGATWARSGVWSSWPALAEQGVQQHPLSRRAHLDHISMLLAQGRNEEAAKFYDSLEAIGDAASIHAAILGRVWLQCHAQQRTDAATVTRIATIAGQPLELGELLGAERLGNLLIQRDCDGLTKSELATLLKNMTDETTQPQTLTPVWRMRFMASRLYQEDGQLALAIEQAALAWMTGKADPAVGVLLSALYMQQGDSRSGAVILNDVRRKLPEWDNRNRRFIEMLERKIEDVEVSDEKS